LRTVKEIKGEKEVEKIGIVLLGVGMVGMNIITRV